MIFTPFLWNKYCCCFFLGYHTLETYVDFIIIIYIYPFSNKKRTRIFPDLGWHQCIVEILSICFRTGVPIVIFIFVKKDLYQFNYFLFYLFYVGAPPCLVSFWSVFLFCTQNLLNKRVTMCKLQLFIPF